MRTKYLGQACAALLALIATGCSMGRQVSNFSIDYNRAIARSRDEMLFLNIIRARYREPLQFSTVSGVTGSLQVGGTLAVPSNNVLAWRTHGAAGGAANVSPSLTLSTTSSPTFSIQPLSDKDFTAEMLTPISPDTVDLLLKLNWDSEFVMPLLIGSVTCNGQTTVNTFHPGRDWLARTLRDSEWRATVQQVPQSVTPNHFTVSAEKAAEMLHHGVGDGYDLKLTSIDPAKQTADMVISEKPGTAWSISGLPVRCTPRGIEQISGPSPAPESRAAKPALLTRPPSPDKSDTAGEMSVQFRSVEAIIYYLGEAVRNEAALTYNSDCVTSGAAVSCPKRKTLFEAHTGSVTAPVAVDTQLEGERYWIPVATSNPDDRTLSTLSLLSELIALQTRDDTKALPQPVINVGPGAR